MSKKTPAQNRTIAVFDFDGTLAACDSLWPFLVEVAGTPRCMLAVLAGLWAYVTMPKGGDRRTIIKAKLLEHILRGRHVDSLRPAIERMRHWPRWMESAAALKWHNAQGHHIVIATGSLDLYIGAMLGDLPHDAILSTEMETVDGILTGHMTLGNCVRKRKAERVAAYIEAHGPFADSWAYGNAPHDLPMMDLMNHRIVI